MGRRFTHLGLLWLLLFAFAGASSGCASDEINMFTGSEDKEGKDGDKTKGKGGDDSDDGDDSGDDDERTETFEDSGARFQVKSIELLDSSIEACMGSGMTEIKSTMLLPANLDDNPPDLPEGRIRFLLPTRYEVGDDIVLKERGNLVSAENGTRTSVAADAVTDTYLRALETVANVVAHNCTLNRSNCDCRTEEKVQGILAQCLPGLNPNTDEMADAAKFLALICNKGDAGMRKAIASLLSSYAFAAAR